MGRPPRDGAMDLEPRGPEDGETNYEARDHGALEQQVLALLSILKPGARENTFPHRNSRLAA